MDGVEVGGARGRSVSLVLILLAGRYRGKDREIDRVHRLHLAASCGQNVGGEEVQVGRID
jgi:hypothetical protein